MKVCFAWTCSQARDLPYNWKQNLNNMKTFYGAIFLMITLFYSSCAVVESIFKAGVWVGVLIVVAIIGLIVWLVSKFSRKG